MPLKEIMTIYLKVHMKPINTCGASNAVIDCESK
jgi:hypothetical protein